MELHILVNCLHTISLLLYSITLVHTGGGGEIPWCFSQVKGTIEDEVADGKDTIIYHLLPTTQPPSVSG